ncbi:MAG: UTP--glucose-1-phosphate uridylyltransferase [Solirubrobacterales bacterium]|nr:UTP--glucose-1-phosphate uridylyltransferase [Solirubrobacterales bacterium]
MASVEHPAVAKLRADGAGAPAVQAFTRAVDRIAAGETGLITERELDPVTELPDAEALPPAAPDAVAAALDRAVVIKLNGGLGTSMGLTGPKALLEVKEGRTFLDLIAEQVLHLRARTGARLPLVLMHSFATREPSLAALAAHPGIAEQDVPQDFLQGRVPKLRAEDLEPAEHAPDPALEWAPPGHGDLYASLVSSGMLAALLDAGYRHAFVSNADNLGAVLDPELLAWFVAEKTPFLMEVADRAPADRKGGHLARRRDGGGLVLRELAQAPDADLGSFQDTGRHRFFNTNSLWIDLPALEEALRVSGGALDLPLIVNRKTVDPKDPDSTPVLQLESAMGAAIDVWPGAEAIRVPRARYAPVKTTNDLLAVRSDAFEVTEDHRVTLAAGRDGAPPLIDLDAEHYKLLGAFEERFAAGAPSLVGCDTLEVVGDVGFGAGVVVEGRVRVVHEGPGRREIADGSQLHG